MALRIGLCSALNDMTLHKLNSHGIKTVTDFILKDAEILSQNTRIPYKDIISIQRVLLAEYSALPGLASGLYKKAISSLMILSTGCQKLDSLLDGGLYTGELIEIAGDTATGKTRICMLSSAMAVITGNHSVAYIDTTLSFSAEYFTELLSEKLETHSHGNSATKYLDLKLIVIDSLASLIYPIMGAVNITFCQGLLCQLGQKLKQLATNFSLAVLVSNYLTSSFNGRTKKASLGKAWSHIPNTRLMLQKPLGSHNFAKEAVLIKSRKQQTTKSVVFTIDNHEFG